VLTGTLFVGHKEQHAAVQNTIPTDPEVC